MDLTEPVLRQSGKFLGSWSAADLIHKFGINFLALPEGAGSQDTNILAPGTEALLPTRS